MCRMLCWRRRDRLLDRSEQLARLRPRAIPRSIAQSTSTTGLATASSSSSSIPTSVSPPSTSSSFTSFFASMRHRLEPYSIVYIRGAPDGVVGRYMEEMEYDDGHYDFASISRGASDTERRRNEGGIEWLDWGEQGALLHLPLTSILHPFLTFPQTLSRVFSPSFNLLRAYSISFTDGSQVRALERFRQHIRDGGARSVLDKVYLHYVKKGREQLEEVERRKEAARAEVDQRARAKGQQTPGKGV